MRWDDLQRTAPGLGAACHERLIAPGVVLVGTVRRDGTARISPVEPYVFDGDLWLSMLWGSHKAADLRRDPRVLVHGIVTSRDGRDGEVKLRGKAVPVDDFGAMADAVHADLGWRPEPGRTHVSTVELESVAWVRYAENGDQRTSLWPAGTEVVRRCTGDTTLGPPEPAS